TLKKCPDSVRRTPLMASPKPAPKNITPSSKAPATILHFTHAESAIASRDRIAIQINEDRIRLPAIQRFDHVQLAPARPACMANRINPGTHVICDSRIASTDDLPSTYSARENGRQKYSGRAPLARSGEINPGPAKAVNRKANTPCPLKKLKKNLLSIDSTPAGTPNCCRKLAL